MSGLGTTAKKGVRLSERLLWRDLAQLPLERYRALRLLEQGQSVRGAARAIGRSASTVWTWRTEILEHVESREEQSRSVYRRDLSFHFSDDTREQLHELLDGGDARMIDSAIHNAEDAARFYLDMEEKQTRAPGNARGPNRQARDWLRAQLAWIFDAVYSGDERDRRGRKAEFIDIVLRLLGAPAPKLERGEMPAVAENWAVKKRGLPSRARLISAGPFTPACRYSRIASGSDSANEPRPLASPSIDSPTSAPRGASSRSSTRGAFSRRSTPRSKTRR